MNPILAEDIMRKRAHRSVIVLATALACLLFVTDRASADGITIVVPVNMTNLHEDIGRIAILGFLRHGAQIVASAQPQFVNVVDRSVQEDVELSISFDNVNAFNADTYHIKMHLGMMSGGSVLDTYCQPNNLYESTPSGSLDHCKNGVTVMQTYAPLTGPISDLTPE
jgi:hypothetical protein